MVKRLPEDCFEIKELPKEGVNKYLGMMFGKDYVLKAAQLA